MNRVGTCITLAILLGVGVGPATAQEEDEPVDPVLAAAVGDVLVEAEPGHAGVLKVTYICRVGKAGGKAKRDGGASESALADCEGVAANQFTPWGYSWVGTGVTNLAVDLYPKGSGIADSNRLTAAFTSAFSVWAAADAAEADSVNLPSAQITTKGSGIKPPARKKDGKNVISWGNLAGGTLAVTQIYIQGTKILEFDMTFNKLYSWANYLSAGEVGTSCGSLGSQFDVEHIAAHETGHAYGLSHPAGSDGQLSTADPRLTMYYAGGTGEVHNRTLNTGDVTGIRFVY
jgi:hypothetical protein